MMCAVRCALLAGAFVTGALCFAPAASDPGSSEPELPAAPRQASPTWPEDIGRIPRPAAERALHALDALLETRSTGDGGAEARVRRALLRLEPLPGRDPERARADLLAAASDPGAGPWAATARLALGWIEEQQGNLGRARAAYGRIAADLPGSEAATRALAGIGRVLLRTGAFGPAAWSFQQAVARQAPLASRAAALRELAVRSILRRAGAGGGWGKPRATLETGIRRSGGMVAVRGGGVVIADDRAGALIELDREGRPVGAWKLGGVQALATDRFGRVVVAAGQSMFRLDPDGPVPIASLGSLGPCSAIALDDQDRIWIVDRRGERLARIGAEGGSPEPLWERKGARIVAVAWTGTRLIAADGRGGGLLAIPPNGPAQRFGPPPPTIPERPAALAADAAGQIAILDGRSGEVVLIDRDGLVSERRPAEPGSRDRAVLLALGEDGSLELLGSGGLLVRIP